MNEQPLVIPVVKVKSGVPVVKGTDVTNLPAEAITGREATTNPNNNYNLYQDSTPNHGSSNVSYPNRGFSSSICSMFHSSRDCCAFAFCGMLQWDYNYYLITHEYPPSLWCRAFRHIFVPSLIFLAAAFCATRIQDRSTNELSVTVLMLLFFLYITGDCILERMRRMKFRERMVDTLLSTNNLVEADKTQSKADYYCSHRLCGCYTVDDEMEVDHDTATLLPSDNGDICTILWQFFANLCCAKCCGCWIQCCGICAIAQEAREIERYVGHNALMIDYVTFEPYAEYYAKNIHLRFTKNGNLLEHYRSISELSMLMLKTLVITIFILTGLALLDYQESFTWGNLLVFILTFSQAFAILYFVHWKWNRFDLSLDSVIKYFSVGFLISTTLAIVFETFGSLFVNIFFNFIIILTSSSSSSSASIVNDSFFSILSEFNKQSSSSNDKSYQKEHAILYVTYLFVTSFLVAAFIEEICKYYGYLMLDHPDMLQDYKKIFQQVEELGEASSKEDSTGGTSANSSLHVFSAFGKEQVSLAPNSDNNELESPLTEISSRRNLNSFASGITIAMITVAMGFACCENLIYIFIYTRGGASVEVAVLVARSLFPVHPLCAAIQSIGVCRRLLENDSSYGVGKSIFPALLLHGTFDFTLMLCAFFASQNESVGDTNDDDVNNNFHGETEDSDGFMASSSFLIVFFIVMFGFIYYNLESNKQKERLDSQDAVEREDNTGSLGCCSRYIYY